MNTSAPATASRVAASICAADSTSTRSIPGGVCRPTGPAISVTRAPARRAARATANPIFPELRFVRYRTGSIASRVGPAVTTTRRPASGPPGGAADKASTMSVGSSIRPAPVSPQAWSPSPGPRNVTPRAMSRSTLSRVAGFAHMTRFIAGARTTGASDARHSVVSRVSAIPAASRAIRSAVAGAMRMTSAHLASSMCPIAASASVSQRSVRTGRPDTAWKVSGVTKCVAASVMTTCTSAPRSRRRRTRSGDL